MIACKRTALPLIVDASPRGRRAPLSEKPHAPDSRNGLWRRRFRGVTFVHRRRPAARTTGLDAAADRQTRPRYQLRHTDVTLLGDAGRMCGIAGEIRFDGHDADVAAVARINEAMHRRGPDGSGVHAMGRAAFGHRRLKILDLSECGAQPMVDNELGLTTVFNGLIYNFAELKEELQGHGYRFFSTTDTEVLVKAFHKWGPSCVERFLGMFAFAILDRDTGVLTLGRDRLGIKPLYYTQNAGRLRFASSLPALLQGGGIDTGIDRVALHHYMTFHSVVPAPRTILEGVRKLPPATVRTVAPDGTVSDHVYWRPEHVRRPGDRGVRHEPPADPGGPGPTPAGRRRGDHGDGRADGQPRLRRLLPPVAGGLEVGHRGAVRAGRGRGLRRLQLVPAPGAGAARAGCRGVRQGLHRPPAR